MDNILIEELTELVENACKSESKEMDMEIEEGIQYIKGKINRDWNKMSERSKEIFKDKYEKVIVVIS